MVGRLCRRVVEVIVDVREASTLQSEEKQSSSWLTLVVVVAAAAAAGPTNSYSQCRKKLISWSSGHSVLDNATVLLPVMLLFYSILCCSALLYYCTALYAFTVAVAASPRDPFLQQVDESEVCSSGVGQGDEVVDGWRRCCK